MSQYLAGRSRLAAHLLLGAVFVACAIVVAHSPSPRRAVASVAAATFAAHAGIAIAIHAGVALAGAGILLAAIRVHGRARREDGQAPGATLHFSRFYDWLAAAYCLGREGRMRERTLDVAGVGPGEHVLDVGCGTGTLALAARRRMGARGSVHAVDASEEMIARARTKSARRALPAAFEVAAAWEAAPGRGSRLGTAAGTVRRASGRPRGVPRSPTRLRRCRARATKPEAHPRSCRSRPRPPYDHRARPPAAPRLAMR